MKLNIYSSSVDTARALILYILKQMDEQPGKIFNIAFSGGSTPTTMFDLWVREYAKKTAWGRMKVWWVDERCVHPKSTESNYGVMKRFLLSIVPIPLSHIFRIRGERRPQAEAIRYSLEVEKHVPKSGRFPAFDIVLLGVGDDGHTSSIFPGQEHLLSSDKIYEVSKHPQTKQQRIALTGNPILNALQTIFLVTGKSKAKVVREIFTSGDVTPAAYIAHHAGNVTFFVDESAASELDKSIPETLKPNKFLQQI